MRAEAQLLAGVDDLVPPRSRVSQFVAHVCAFTTVHQDFVLDETFELTYSLLEMLLLIFFDTALIDKYRLVHRIVQRLVQGLQVNSGMRHLTIAGA